MQYQRLLLAIVICVIFVHGAERPANTDSARVDTVLSDAYAKIGRYYMSVADYVKAVRLDHISFWPVFFWGFVIILAVCLIVLMVKFAKKIKIILTIKYYKEAVK